MKIAITGHSAGIGQAIAKIYTDHGHEIVGLSRRNGYNIRSVPKIVSMVEPCDVFVNNAQTGFAQTELFFEVWRRWQGQRKCIINISSQMTLWPSAPTADLDEYFVQKKALEEASKQLRGRALWPLIITVRPGAVATQPEQTSPEYANVDEWADKLIGCFDITHPEYEITEITLGPNRHGS